MFVLYLTYYSLLNYKVTFCTDINCFWEFKVITQSVHIVYLNFSSIRNYLLIEKHKYTLEPKQVTTYYLGQ